MHNIRPFLPELFENPGTLLYIGARQDAHSWLKELHEVGNNIVIIEIWQHNIDTLDVSFNGLYVEDTYRDIMLAGGDIRNFDEYHFPRVFANYPNGFDYIFWWHGPEHLEMSEILTVLQNLESKTNRLIALASPYGWYPQGPHNGNPYEEHKSTLYPKFFELLGYHVKTDGLSDEPGSEIVAWKKLQSEVSEV